MTTDLSFPHVSPVLVIGAGPNGLATAALLRRAHVPAIILERSDAAAATWRAQHDDLRLNTTPAYSSLPGLAVPRQAGPWLSRDDFVRYLERYAAHHRLDIRANTPVHRIEPAEEGGDGRWLVHTADTALPARAVVVATGRCHTPRLPDWPGRASFPGGLVHSSDYRSPQPYRDRDVLVVGAGNSGTEIAVALVRGGAKRVWIAVRTPPSIVPRSIARWQCAAPLAQRLPPAWADAILGVLHRFLVPDLTPFGLPRPGVGPFTRNARDDANPVLDHGFVAAVRAGQVTPVATVDRFEGERVVLADGTHLTPDAVIAATGYRPDLRSLVGGLGVLDDAGYPTIRGEHTSPNAPHLYFSGYANVFIGPMYAGCLEARAIARAIRHDTGRARIPAQRPRPTANQHDDASPTP